MIPTEIVIHHTASSRDKTTIKDVDNWHKARDFTFSSLGYYIGYHFLILADGTTVQTRRLNETGCHCIPNDGKIGICLTGNFQTEQPTSEQIASLSKTIKQIQKAYSIPNSKIKGHRELAKTECPGENLFKWILQNRISWLKELINNFLKC